RSRRPTSLLADLHLTATRRPVSCVITCAQYREEVLEADLISSTSSSPNGPRRQDRLLGSASDGCRAPDPPAVAPVIGVEADEGRRDERKTHATAIDRTPVAIDRQEGRHPRAVADE